MVVVVSCFGLATMEIIRVEELLALAILTWIFLKRLVRSGPRFSVPIAGSPRTWFSYLRPTYNRLCQETPTARIEVVDAATERLLPLQTLPFFGHNADISGVSSGPGPQPLRGMSGFPAQQQAQARNATLASARLPNGKLGAMILFDVDSSGIQNSGS